MAEVAGSLTDRRRQEQRLLLRTELAQRSQADPLRQWQPNGKQSPFVHAVLHGPTWENWFIAANRAGKSEALAYCVATLARDGTVDRPHEPTTGWVVSLDDPTSRDVMQSKIFDNGFVPPGTTPFIPDREIAEWRVSDKILKLKNGSIIGFKSAESGRLKFQGAEKDFVAFDEEQAKPIYEESVIRVGGGRKLRVFGAVTLLPPEGMVGGVSWMYPDIIQPWMQGDLPRVGLFGASIYDNPHIPVEEIARLEAIYPEGSQNRKIRLEGEWLPGMGGARAYPGFSRLLHVKHQGPPNPRRPLAWCWDFNVSPLVSTVGQREGRLFRVFREFALDDGSIADMVDSFRQVYPSHGSEIWVYGDATGKGRTAQTAQSDYTIMLNAMRGYGPVRLKVPEKNPMVRDRVNAVNMVMRDEQGVVACEIDPSCKELIADLEQVLVDDKGGIKKTGNHRDPYFRRTHASDGFGYWIAYEEPVRAYTTSGSQQRGAVRSVTPGYAWSGDGPR